MDATIAIIALIFGILNLILFFKIWGMTNDVADMKQILAKIADKDNGNYVVVSQSSKEENSSEGDNKPMNEAERSNRFADTTWGTFSGSLTRTELKFTFDADGKHYTFSAINYKDSICEEGQYAVNGDTISLEASSGTHKRTLTYSASQDALIPSDSPKELYKKW